MIMKVTYKITYIPIKYIILSFFLFFSLSISMYASQKTTNNYLYIQLNQAQHVGTQISQTTWSPDAKTGTISQKNSDITFSLFYPNFMSNFIVGFMIPDKYGVEMEYSSYDLFSDKINGKTVSNADYVQSNIRLEYVFFNLRQDFWEYKNIDVFYKLGFGFIQPNFASEMADGGANLEYGIQGSVGCYYAINNFLDFEVSYKVLGNYARRSALSSLGFEAKHKIVESSINWGVRFKVHSLMKKDVSIY